MMPTNVVPQTNVFKTIFDEAINFKDLLDIQKSDDEIQSEQKEIKKYETDVKQASKARKEFLKQQITEFNQHLNSKEEKYRRRRNTITKSNWEEKVEFKLPSIQTKNRNHQTLEKTKEAVVSMMKSKKQSVPANMGS